MLTIEFSATMVAKGSSGSSGVLSRWTRPPLTARGHLIHADFHGRGIGRPGRMPPKAWSRLPSVLTRTFENSRSSPATGRDGDPLAAGAEEAVANRMTALCPADPPSGCVLGDGEFRLNDEQSRPRAVDRHGERAVGHRELGAGQQADGGHAIGPRILLIGDDEVETLEGEATRSEG